MKKKILIITLILALLIPNTTFATTEATAQYNNAEPDIQFFMEVYNYIQQIYPFDVENRTLIEGGLKGMLQSLDPYSDYYTPEESIAVYQDMLNIFSGIGIYIEEKDGYINIVDTIKNSPAEKAGLKKDDRILSIDGKDAKGITIQEASKLIKGLKGTKVKLGLKRKNNSLPIYVEITRDTITINPVEYEILENNIGYIKLNEFSMNSTDKFNEALTQLDKKKVKRIILDLRDNPGGLLNQVIEISRNFITKGPIVHIQERNTALVTHMSTTRKSKYKLVVLVNENSASASEILAGAIKDTKAGIIIGKKTFGKGIVQSMIPLNNGSIIRLTTAEYLTPNKISIHGLGVEPDIIVENIEDTDLQLKTAIEVLRNK